ncbi:MAG: hypothetical protein ACRDZQ_03270 [Acidimicrobiales bacterium]
MIWTKRPVSRAIALATSSMRARLLAPSPWTSATLTLTELIGAFG